MDKGKDKPAFLELVLVVDPVRKTTRGTVLVKDQSKSYEHRISPYSILTSKVPTFYSLQLIITWHTCMKGLIQ
uniref:Putative ovule protein n=1 Tax=Solanum chacoense TaxID=4108 RepID=A0A0V0HGB1_SOLCH